jgi:hypothetical protein
VLGEGISTPHRQNVTRDLGFGQIPWNDVGNGRWVWDLELGNRVGRCGLDEDGDQCQAFVNTVMNLRVP